MQSKGLFAIINVIYGYFFLRRSYYYDTDTGLYYLQSRYYDPAIGRFINADVFVSTDITGPLSANMYAYCENNPVNNVDSAGMSATAVALIVLGVLATGHDIYQLARKDDEAVCIQEAEYEYEITNSNKIFTPWVQHAYSAHIAYWSDYSDEIKGSAAGVQYEWTVHNLIYYATGLAKLIFPNNDRIRELNEKTESTGIGSTIFDDRKSGHGKASDIMIATYTIASPISATIDMIIANR